MNSHADVQYKPACPFCRGQGAANEVTMHNYQQTITYVCSTCMKTWTATDHVPLHLMGEERQPSRCAFAHKHVSPVEGARGRNHDVIGSEATFSSTGISNPDESVHRQ